MVSDVLNNGSEISAGDEDKQEALCHTNQWRQPTGTHQSVYCTSDPPPIGSSVFLIMTLLCTSHDTLGRRQIRARSHLVCFAANLPSSMQYDRQQAARIRFLVVHMQGSSNESLPRSAVP
jgi:hypothetical protein